MKGSTLLHYARNPDPPTSKAMEERGHASLILVEQLSLSKLESGFGRLTCLTNQCSSQKHLLIKILLSLTGLLSIPMWTHNLMSLRVILSSTLAPFQVPAGALVFTQSTMGVMPSFHSSYHMIWSNSELSYNRRHSLLPNRLLLVCFSFSNVLYMLCILAVILSLSHIVITCHNMWHSSLHNWHNA